MDERRYSAGIRLSTPAAAGLTMLLVLIPLAHVVAEVSVVTLCALTVLQPWSERVYG
jgi:hypothetical protein